MTTLKQIQEAKLTLEKELIGAVLENNIALLNYLVPKNFTDQSPVSHRYIWSICMKVIPEHEMALHSINKQLVKDNIANQKEYYLYLIQAFNAVYRNVGAGHCLQLLEYDIRLKLHNILAKLSAELLLKKEAQVAGVLTQTQEFSIDLDEDFHEMLDTVKGYIQSQSLEEVAAPVLELINAVDHKADQIRKQAAWEACLNNINGLAKERLPEPYDGLMFQLTETLNKVAKQEPLSNELIDQIFNLSIND